MKTIQNGWLSKEAGAAALGVRIRQLENRAAKGEVRKQTLPRQPNERAARVMYSVEDIEAIKRGTPNRYGSSNSSSNAVEKREVTAMLAGDPFAGLAQKLAGLAAFAAQYSEPKPWLTLTEAVKYSGLPEAYLLTQAAAGAAFAVRTGQGSRANWRFNRDALGRS